MVERDNPEKRRQETWRNGILARAEAALEAELAYLRSIAPPVAINPAAPSWARHPDPMIRGAQSDLHGWDPDWERPG